MENFRFYPAIERKNDFIVKNVQHAQLDRPVNHTHRKSVLKGKVLLGFNAYDIPNPSFTTQEEWDKLVCKSADMLKEKRTVLESVYK